MLALSNPSISSGSLKAYSLNSSKEEFKKYGVVAQLVRARGIVGISPYGKIAAGALLN